MKMMTKAKLIALMLAPAALLACTGCVTTLKSPTSSDPNASIEAGVPGGTIVDTYELTAKVTAVDTENRMVTLAGENDNQITFYCGPGVRNFDQIHVDDKVSVMLTDQLAVAVADANTPPDGTSTKVLLSPKGGMPGGIAADITQYSVTLVGIDTLRHWATFRFPDGLLRTYVVRPDVNLANLKLGQEVVVRATKTYAVWVRCP
jgi:hypothetical protein